LIGRIVRRAALLLPVALAAVGAGPDRPPAAAARDAEIGYHLRPATGEAIDVRVQIKAGGAAFRVDLPDTSYLVGVPANQSLTMVVPLERTLLALGWDEGPQSLFTVDEGARFTRRGEAVVAAQRCTLWDATVDGVAHALCVSPDGLVLRNQFQDKQGRRNLVEAFSVRFDPLSDADFAVPADYAPIVPGPGPVQ
jgi:hypothetical protein